MEVDDEERRAFRRKVAVLAIAALGGAVLIAMRALSG